MAEKMYYSEQEAAEKLGVPAEKLSELVQQQKLRVFMDGSRRMYKGDEIEALAESGEPRKLYEIYAERARELAASPPPDDWDGVYVFTTK